MHRWIPLSFRKCVTSAEGGGVCWSLVLAVGLRLRSPSAIKQRGTKRPDEGWVEEAERCLLLVDLGIHRFLRP